jgi:hypothetical protein
MNSRTAVLTALVLGSALSAAPAAATPVAPAAEAAPPVQSDTLPVRPGRLAALSTPLTDDDLRWLLPLLSAQAADARRERTLTAAGAHAIGIALSPEVGEARVRRIRSGEVHALNELRAYSPQARVPTGARYDAACSAGVTEGLGGIIEHAVFVVARLEASTSFYSNARFRVLGDAGTGYVLRSPDGRIAGTLSGSQSEVRRIGRDVAAGRAPGYDHLRPCADLADGHVLILTSEGSIGEQARGAEAAAGTAPERLPQVLAAAGLSAAQWGTVVTLLWYAATDDLFAHDPAALDRVAGSADAGNVRRANVAWYARHRAVLDPAMQALGPDTTAGVR